MSAAAVTGHDTSATRHGRVTQVNLLRAEWTKLWTLRSTRWSLLAAVGAMAGLGILVALIQMNNWTHMSVPDRAHYDSIDTGVGGYHLAQLAIGVLGVMVISGEYSTGMIRSSFMAVPHRLPVLWAKLGVFSAVTFGLMLASSIVSFFTVQAIVTRLRADGVVLPGLAASRARAAGGEADRGVGRADHRDRRFVEDRDRERTRARVARADPRDGAFDARFHRKRTMASVSGKATNRMPITPNTSGVGSRLFTLGLKGKFGAGVVLEVVVLATRTSRVDT